jgi:CRISPR-associated protein Csx17
MTVNDIELKGCAPVPLAHYLKALGILRLVAEQADPEARGYWRGDTFVLRTKLDKIELSKFFLHEYRPTPIVAPWNSGSGFYYQEEKLKQKDLTTNKRIKTGMRNQPTAATRIVDSLLSSSGKRFEQYRQNIKVIKNLIGGIGYTEAPDSESKENFIQAVRNNLPDDAIGWIDAAVVLTSEKAKYPPLLGTGGNDGNTDFTSNFMQRQFDVFNLDGKPTKKSQIWLDGALFSTPQDGLLSGVAIGQFFPSAVGGLNSITGFDSNSLVNPWDFILMIEGTLLFAAASVKRLKNSELGVLSYPFSVRTSGVGYGSATKKDEDTSNSRAEIWVPMWNRPALSKEITLLFSEGRAQVGMRQARNGVDFARAVSTLGVDRGISSFQRYGFHVRNGLAYFATPLSRFEVKRQPQADLLSDIDQWFANFARKAASDEAPASVGRASRQLEESIIRLCKNRGVGRVQDILIALGECERTLAKSKKWAKDTAYVQPISNLSRKWLSEADDNSTEFRLAASFASISGIRSNFEQVHNWIDDGHLKAGWNKDNNRDVAWLEGNPIQSMVSIMSRRVMNAVKSSAGTYPDSCKICADLGDIADFIEGRVDVERMAKLLWGLVLVDWPQVEGNEISKRESNEYAFPGAAYGLLKLCFAGRKVRDVSVPIVSEIYRKASVGEGVAATQLAVRRLRGCDLPPVITAFDVSHEKMKCIAAALIFPIGYTQIDCIANRVLRNKDGGQTE